MTTKPLSQALNEHGIPQPAQPEPSPGPQREAPPRGDPDETWQRLAPSRFRHAHLDQLDDQVREAAQAWLAEPHRNLLLVGNVGAGKTHAALAITRAAITNGHTAVFWPVVELLDALRPTNDQATDTYERALKRDVLVLDDLGAEKPSDWTAERLFALINRRWLEQRAVIATSNLAVSNGQGPLVDAVGQRVYDRLVQDAVTLRIGGNSRRRA